MYVSIAWNLMVCLCLLDATVGNEILDRRLLWPASAILLRLYAHSAWCSAELRFLPSVFSAMPSIFQLCWALFCSVKHFSSMLDTCCFCHEFFFCAEHFSALPSIFRPRYTSRPFQSFLFHAERCIGSSKRFSSVLSGFSALPCIFLLCCVLYGIEEKCLAERKITLSIIEVKWLVEPESV